MSALEPSGPAQPDVNEAYKTSGNAASKEPYEEIEAQARSKDPSMPTDQRIPQKQSTSIEDSTPTSLARGIRGTGPGEDPSRISDNDSGRIWASTEAEQMRAPGEGRVADAVEAKPGASGSQPGLESDLDKKKAEQEPLREAEKQRSQHEIDVGGVLGQSGGPASTVD